MAGGSISPPGGFSKNSASKETMKPCLFGSFNIIIIHIFPECFIEIHHAGGSYVIKNLFVNIGYFHCFSSIFLIVLNFFDKETNDVSLQQIISSFFPFQYTLNRFFNNCIKLY